MRFPEEFLHFVWQFRLFDQTSLCTDNGERLKILHVGFKNGHAGPDFIQAKLQIDETVWVGNIEIHVNASEWNLHKHQADAAYNNVVLHVVYNNNEPVFTQDGRPMPTLSLKNLIDLELMGRYQNLMVESLDFPCQRQIGQLDGFVIRNFLGRVLVERLEEKSVHIYEKVNQLKGNWDEAFYHFMARNFGFKINALPMELLAQSLPQNLFAKHKNQPLQLQALIFGQAGFLQQDFDDEYPQRLKTEYQFLKKKYSLSPVQLAAWKFLRMRPQNFPTLRLAQFAALVGVSNHLFSSILSVENYKDVRTVFAGLPVHDFWQTHYHFNKPAQKFSPQLGQSSVDNLLINTVSTFLFAYGKHTGQENLVTRAIYILEDLVTEKNSITQIFADAGVRVSKASESQALLQLKKRYCDAKRCLDCGIGIKLLRK